MTLTLSKTKDRKNFCPKHTATPALCCAGILFLTAKLQISVAVVIVVVLCVLLFNGVPMVMEKPEKPWNLPMAFSRPGKVTEFKIKNAKRFVEILQSVLCGPAAGSGLSDSATTLSTSIHIKLKTNTSTVCLCVECFNTCCTMRKLSKAHTSFKPKRIFSRLR